MSTPGPTLAVDFGTAGTAAVLRWADGRTEPLLFAGSSALASGVFADDWALLTGTEAQLKAFSHPGAYEPNPKRHIEQAQLQLGLRSVPVVELIAAVLHQVWGAARAVAGNTPITVALTHPAGWTRRSTDVLAEAAWRAGMPTPRLVSEPVAAACYAVEVQRLPVAVGASVVVCDYGAGGFTATVVRRESTGYTVLATQAQADAGGLDIDARLLAHLGASIAESHPREWRQVVEPATDTDRQAALLIRDLVVQTKHALSAGAREVNFSVPALSVSLPIGRDALESILRPVLDGTVSATRLAVRAAGLSEAALAAVFVVGGGRHLPLVDASLRDRLGVQPIHATDGDLALAVGAARPTAVPLAGGVQDTRAAASPSGPAGPPPPPTPWSPGEDRRDATGLPPTAPWSPVFDEPTSPAAAPIGRTPAVPAGPVDWRALGAGPPAEPVTLQPARRATDSRPVVPESSPASVPPVPQDSLGYLLPGHEPAEAYTPPWATKAWRSTEPAWIGKELSTEDDLFVGRPRWRGPSRRAVLGGVTALVLLAGAALLLLRPWSSGHPSSTPPPAVALPSTGPRGTAAVSYTTGDNDAPVTVDGAQRGGTLTVLDRDILGHLDPVLAANPDERAAGQLIYRALTAVRTNPDGSATVIGDLATHPGLDVKHDCTQWRYTLREGVQFEDGTPVTAQDVAHGVARSLNAPATGSTTLQRWLVGDDYASRYDGVHAPGVSTPDARTIEFTFARPHCDMPYLASLPTTAPVPVAAPAGADYDKHPVSSGPYRVAGFSGNVLELSRNPYWKAQTDPLRLAGPDTIRIGFGVKPAETVKRIAANAGEDQSALSWAPNARGDAATAGATSDRDSTSVGNAPMYLAFNLAKVPDLAVRQAISYAVDKRAVIDTRSNPTWASTVLTSICDPAHLGYQSYPDPYPLDPAKARTLLGGRTLTLTLAIAVNASRVLQAGAIKQALAAVGITVNVVRVDDPDGLRAGLVKPGTTWDIALLVTGPSWPTAYRQLENLLDGRGGQLSTLNDPGVNARFDALDKLPVDQQNAQAAQLDRAILTDLDPLVPIFYDQVHFIHGTRVTNVPVSAVFGLPDLTTAWISTG